MDGFVPWNMPIEALLSVCRSWIGRDRGAGNTYQAKMSNAKQEVTATVEEMMGMVVQQETAGASQ